MDPGDSSYSARGVQDSPNQKADEFIDMVLDSNRGGVRGASALLGIKGVGDRHEPHTRESTPASSPVIMEMS